MRVTVSMSCTQCKQRNYMTTKNKKKHAEKLELRKYCRFCNQHTLHREGK
ncbi:MAG: 50S ribosomal protein L33 [Syntrophomonadaceae bacterium]|nr:50S ribosomal protein L33 [Syntrophomonadaceae bacterium]